MSIQDAVIEMDEAKEEAADTALRRRLRKDVEAGNLLRDRQVPAEMWKELVELDGLLPVRAPKRLWEARNTARLHDAILDWEGELLDEVAPQRPSSDHTPDD